MHPSQNPNRYQLTLVEQFLRGLVGIHAGLSEHGVDVGIGVVANDLLDGLNGFSDRNGDYLTLSIQPRPQDHLSRDLAAAG